MVTWVQGQEPIAQHVLSRVIVDISGDIDLCSLGESILVKDWPLPPQMATRSMTHSKSAWS